jgi:hypothetical protein
MNRGRHVGCVRMWLREVEIAYSNKLTMISSPSWLLNNHINNNNLALALHTSAIVLGLKPRRRTCEHHVAELIEGKIFFSFLIHPLGGAMLAKGVKNLRWGEASVLSKLQFYVITKIITQPSASHNNHLVYIQHILNNTIPSTRNGT